jgi:hypothetical protein
MNMTTMNSKKSKTEILVAWLTERPALKINVLEEEAKIPFTTISQAQRGREIPEKHWPAIISVLKKYGLNPKLIKIKE